MYFELTPGICRLMPASRRPEFIGRWLSVLLRTEVPDWAMVVDTLIASGFVLDVVASLRDQPDELLVRMFPVVVEHPDLNDDALRLAVSIFRGRTILGESRLVGSLGRPLIARSLVPEALEVIAADPNAERATRRRVDLALSLATSRRFSDALHVVEGVPERHVREANLVAIVRTMADPERARSVSKGTLPVTRVRCLLFAAGADPSPRRLRDLDEAIDTIAQVDSDEDRFSCIYEAATLSREHAPDLIFRLWLRVLRAAAAKGRKAVLGELSVLADATALCGEEGLIETAKQVQAVGNWFP
jgi:hypothetical protein